MHNIYVKDLLRINNSKLVIGSGEKLLDNFSKDTRTLKERDIYIGIKGEKFEGSNLYKEALEKGAKGCILNNIELDLEYLKKYSDRFVITCDDTIKCIQALASYKRDLYDIPVIGITGSVGKTSTKDMIASVLSKKYNVLKTEGNYNNHIGVPLTILRLKDENLLVVEMGMNNLGEISVLSKIAKPTVGVITNVGTAHIGNLGSRENILKAKMEICDGMENGKLIINNDNDLLHKYYLEHGNNIITYGIINDSNYMASNIDYKKNNSEFNSVLNGTSHRFKVNVPGEAFIYNSLSAISVGSLFNMDYKDIYDGISNFNLTKERMDIESINGVTIINDCYNANLDSMKNAINYLGTYKERKVAIIGDMLELGEYSKDLHKEVGKCLKDNNIDIVITVGDNSKVISEVYNKEIYNYDNNKEVMNKIKSIIKKNDVILIKASNSMNFIEIYSYIKEILK